MWIILAQYWTDTELMEMMKTKELNNEQMNLKNCTSVTRVIVLLTLNYRTARVVFAKILRKQISRILNFDVTDETWIRESQLCLFLLKSLQCFFWLIMGQADCVSWHPWLSRKFSLRTTWVFQLLNLFFSLYDMLIYYFVHSILRSVIFFLFYVLFNSLYWS